MFFYILYVFIIRRFYFFNFFKLIMLSDFIILSLISISPFQSIPIPIPLFYWQIILYYFV